MKSLRSAASGARRTTLAPRSRQFGSMSTIGGRPIGSSDNLNRDDNESIGTDGAFLLFVGTFLSRFTATYSGSNVTDDLRS